MSIGDGVSEAKMNVAYFGPWIGEFGWELMAWQAWCRQEAEKYDKSYVCSFVGMEPLYQDFAEFIPHKYTSRALDWTKIGDLEYDIPVGAVHIEPVKSYRLGGKFIKFGNRIGKGSELLVHARGVSRGSYKNYLPECWKRVVDGFDDVACVGSKDDQYIEGTRDLRGIPLQSLMDIIASSGLVVGQSSGVMHLASLCGTPHIVWGDARTYFGETLEKRYEETWNPLGTEMEFIFHDQWRPEPGLIISAIERRLGMGTEMRMELSQEMSKTLAAAVANGRWMMTLTYMKQDGGLEHTWQTHDFDRADILWSLEHLKVDMVRQGEIDAVLVNKDTELGEAQEEQTGWH